MNEYLKIFLTPLDSLQLEIFLEIFGEFFIFLNSNFKFWIGGFETGRYRNPSGPVTPVTEKILLVACTEFVFNNELALLYGGSRDGLLRDRSHVSMVEVVSPPRLRRIKCIFQIISVIIPLLVSQHAIMPLIFDFSLFGWLKPRLIHCSNWLLWETVYCSLL